MMFASRVKSLDISGNWDDVVTHVVTVEKTSRPPGLMTPLIRGTGVEPDLASRGSQVVLKAGVLFTLGLFLGSGSWKQTDVSRACEEVEGKRTLLYVSRHGPHVPPWIVYFVDLLPVIDVYGAKTLWVDLVPAHFCRHE